MSTPETTPPPAPSPETAVGLSQVSRITNVFFAPSATFNDIKRNASWWAAWLLISVFSMIFVFAMQQKVGFVQMMQNEINASPKAAERMEKLSPEQRAQQMDMGASFTKYISYATPLIILVVAVVVAAVLMGSFNFGTGAEIKFSTALAVVMYSYVPGILKGVLGAIALYAGADPESFNPRNPIATNLGFVLSRADHPVLYSLASSVDLFAIWAIILMGIGFSCVSKVKRSTATSIVAGWYVVIILIGAGWVAIMS